ncbi:MAG: lysylphosphatidylglycerol synthase transmembrane domain-containing protein [Elusimicrobia bacterium]|nr:lysylphosphatidylglycerol synthase transmembrane domain-containing protein [Elusimicrobiota bacterium]
MSRKKVLSAVVAFAITGFFLWLALRKVEFAALGAALAAARFGWLIPMLAIVYLDLLVRAARWRVLLSRTRPLPAPVWDLFKLEAIGLAVNNVLLLRLGELARAGLAARRLGIPAAAALASVAIERALDVAALLTIFVLATRLAPGIAPVSVVRAALLLLGAAIGALIVLAAAESSLAPGGFAERRLRRWPRVHTFVEQLALGAAVLRSPAAAAKAAALSLLLWSVDAALYWAGAYALGLGGIMDYPRAVLTLSWAGAISAIPAAPGGIGTFENFVASILHTFGASPDLALAYALLTHMIMYLLVTVTGLVFLSREGVSLAQLREEVERNK